jgi:hypothetical protein
LKTPLGIHHPWILHISCQHWCYSIMVSWNHGYETCEGRGMPIYPKYFHFYMYSMLYSY